MPPSPWWCIPESVKEKVDVLMANDVENMLLYRKIVVDLAGQCINPGRKVIIHVFLEAAKEHLVKRLCGISQSKYKNQGWIQWLRNLFTQQGIKYRELMREITHVEMICLIFANLQLQLKEKNNRSKRHSVSFSDEIVVYSIPHEDRKSP